MTPKSRERRHTNGWIDWRKCFPSARSPAETRARMKAAQLHGSAEGFIMRYGRVDWQTIGVTSGEGRSRRSTRTT